MTQDVSTSAVGSPARRLGFKAATGILVIVAAITLLAIQLSATSGSLSARLWRAPEEPTPAGTGSSTPVAKTEAQPFRNWPANKAPDLVLVFSGQQYGFIQPCGCSHPQYGGLPRRYAFLQELKKRGWPVVVGVDLGDLLASAPLRGPQSLLKYELSMKALKLMGYVAVGLGQHEAELPLIETLGHYALNEISPRILAANLRDRQTNFANMVGGWVLAQTPHHAPRVGVVGVVGPVVQQKIPNQNPPIDFAPTLATLQTTLKDMQPSKPDFRVLLYQGNLQEATACATQFPDFNVVLCLSKESEPAQKPERVKDTWVVNVGQKARYVGVIGVFRTGNPKQPFDMKYEMVMLGEEYEKTAEPNPVLQLMETYTQELKTGNYLAQYPRRKHPLHVAYPKAEYVGSDACMGCHRHAYKVWADHPHAHAYDTLVKATRPSNRQFDGECIVCHTVGFGFEKGFENEEKTGQLKEVGCENCHGPGSLHADLGKKTPQSMLDLMNPFRPKPGETKEQESKRLGMIDMDCQKCHDIDNDVNWDFLKKWPKVIHRTPKESPVAAPAKKDE